MTYIKEILNKDNLDKSDLVALLSIETSEEIELLKKKAYEVMKSNIGDKVYLRGLVEFSNYCVYDCQYCGIRKSNSKVTRYILKQEEIVDAAIWGAENGYASFVLQSGERNDESYIDFVCKTVKAIKEQTKSDKLPNGLGITLSVGEQSEETYRRFYAAGAHRYLLRIETTNRTLFSQIHTPEQDFDKRADCLQTLNKIGFQVGTGVMIAIPGQTLEDLAEDIMFFKKMDVDMIGMGPFIVHRDTPMNVYYDEYVKNRYEVYRLALKMIAVTRLYLKDVNIASTTALQAMFPMGREVGLSFGANIIMPQLTPTGVRKEYQLYEGKPCLDEFASDCQNCIENKVAAEGREIGYNEWGDSKHKRKNS